MRKVAGRSALTRYNSALRRWRKRKLRPFFWTSIALVVLFSVLGASSQETWKFYWGLLAGGVIAIYLSLRDSAPHHIDKWFIGGLGEQRTEKTLRTLTREGWLVRHDISRDGDTNFDHVVVGPGGVFLLDTKNFAGEGEIVDSELRVKWIDDPEDGWTSRGMHSRMMGAAVELKKRVQAATHLRVWVTPVVVLWMAFPQKTAQIDEVHFVEGDSLVEWLRSWPPTHRNEHEMKRVRAAIESLDASE